MNLAVCAQLTPISLNGRYYRAADLKRSHTPSDLMPNYTRNVFSRFNPARRLKTAARFSVIYMSENAMTAAAEYEALLPTRTGSMVSNPGISWSTLSVSFRLSRVVDLTDIAVLGGLETTVQELTGDWFGYRVRSKLTGAPTDIAPTQRLGRAMSKVGFEGLLTFSARVPAHRNLVVFADNLQPNSYVNFEHNGTTLHRLP